MEYIRREGETDNQKPSCNLYLGLGDSLGVHRKGGGNSGTRNHHVTISERESSGNCWTVSLLSLSCLLILSPSCLTIVSSLTHTFIRLVSPWSLSYLPLVSVYRFPLNYVPLVFQLSLWSPSCLPSNSPLYLLCSAIWTPPLLPPPLFLVVLNVLHQPQL